MSFEVVEIDKLTVEVVEIGIQGPPGIQGIAGANGAMAAITLIAGANLGGNRVVTGAVAYADSAELATAGKAIGLTAGAATMGAQVNVIASGELDGFSGFSVNAPVYVAANGTVSHSLPSSGYIQRVGIAVSASRLLINISQPLILG